VVFGILGEREVALSRMSHEMARVIKQRNSEIDHLNAEVDSKSAEIVRYSEDLAKQIDESQKAFTVVRQAKQEWEATFDSVADLIVLTDENGKIIRCNRATCQAFQADFNQILGMQIGELFFGSSGSGQEQFPTQRAEMKFPQLDRWYEVLSSALMMDAGQQGRIYLLRDISDRKQATLSLDRQRQYYEALVKNNPIAIVTLNLNQRIVDCNPAFETLFGYPKQEVFGQVLDDLIAPPERTEESRSLSQVVTKGEVVHKITQRQRKDGSLVDVELFGIPIILWGKQIGILGLYHDILGLIRPREEAEIPALAGAGWVVETAQAEPPAESVEMPEVIEPAGLAGVPLDARPFLDESLVTQESQEEDDLSAVQPSLEAVETAPLPGETLQKPSQIEIIEGIGPVYSGKLSAAGVSTTAELLQVAADRMGRQTLADITGISRNLILKWVNRADLMRVPGVGEEYSDLLEAAGVDTVKELRNRNPLNLHTTLAEVHATKGLVRRLPRLSEVQAWVRAAKELEPLVTY
ncbi:MAG TPA: DUF4332 domain-containing protein, partial [Anaerolineales bacterium]|nr:DUF4332 domain-containing protein [Anaerolineales bacterium]